MRNRGPHDRRRRQARRVSFVAGALLSAAAIWLSTWQAELSRDAVGAHRIVELAGAGAIVAMFVLGRRRQRRTSPAWAARTLRLTWGWRGQPGEIRISVLMWCAVIAGLIGWDLFSFVVQSSSFPTLSTLVGHVTRYPVGRGILFALWLVVGVCAVAGSRAGSQE